MTSEFEAHALDALGAVVPVRSRRMFGGIGIWSDELFFALIADEVLYFKVDDRNRGEFEARGMSAFQPFPDKPGMSYFELPQDVLDDKRLLRTWVARSLDAARAKSKTLPRTTARANEKRRKEKLLNLGPVSMRWLSEIGVRSRADLERMGSVAAFLAVKDRGRAPSVNLLYALEGALLELSCDRLPAVVKDNLRRRAGLG